MDKNPLDVALPPPEICLFWIDSWATCMTKSEWSGWMQVVGSLLAVFVAGAIPYWQKWHADKENFNRARQCLLMQCGLIDEMRKIAKAAGDKPRIVLVGAHDLCANLAAMYDEIRPPNMSLEQMAIWRSARVTVAQLSQLIANIRDGKVADAHVVPALESLMETSKKQLEGFGLKAAREPAAK